MPYTDLLRVSVFLTAGEATVLGALSALVVAREPQPLSFVFALGWWTIALVVGLYLGRPSNAAEGVRDALAAARTAHSLPPETPARIALGRLWPIGVSAVVAGVLGIFFPGVAIVGAGYGLLVCLAWRSHEAAVLGVEQRDGTKFYVVPNSALKPVELIRAPGLRSDHVHATP